MSPTIIGCIYLTLLILNLCITNKKIKFWIGLLTVISFLLLFIPGDFWWYQNSIKEFSDRNIDSVLFYRSTFNETYQCDVIDSKHVITYGAELDKLRYELEHVKINNTHPEVFCRAKVYIWSKGKKLVLEIEQTDHGTIISKDANTCYRNNKLEKYIKSVCK